MKKLIVLSFLGCAFFSTAQNNQALIKHYEAYYKQMRTQGDAQGVISGLTHLNVLAPSQARKDTLAYIYMSEDKHLQALNTIGIDPLPTDSDIAVEVKAIALKSVNQTELAIPHFEEMFKRNPNPIVAYELAELNLQLNKLAEAKKHIDYGILTAKDDMMQPFYEMQQPYQVSLKAAFLYLKGLHKFNENKAQNIDAAIALLEQALTMAPKFNMAKISIDALKAQKTNATPKN
jgi:tetratricopeptide (TPR) repeat protein